MGRKRISPRETYLPSIKHFSENGLQENPGRDFYIALFPYLKIEEIIAIEKNIPVLPVACPPLTLGDGCHTVVFEPARLDSKDVKVNGVLIRTGTRLVPRRIRYGGWVTNTNSVNCLYFDRALNFAREKWGSSLVGRGNWTGTSAFVFKDPTKVDESGNAVTENILGVAYNNSEIITMSVVTPICQEIISSRGTAYSYVCSKCAHTFLGKNCRGCRKTSIGYIPQNTNQFQPDKDMLDYLASEGFFYKIY